MPRDALIQYRHGTSAMWAAADPILAVGEPGWDTDLNIEKVGNGSSRWSALAVSGGGSGGGGSSSLIPTVKNASYSAVFGDLVLADATAGPFTVTAPTSPSVGDTFAVMKTDASANSVTVVAAGSTINGDASAEIVAAFAGATFIWAGAGWLILSVMAGSTADSGGGLTIFDGGGPTDTFALTVYDGGTPTSTYSLPVFDGGTP